MLGGNLESLLYGDVSMMNLVSGAACSKLKASLVFVSLQFRHRYYKYTYYLLKQIFQQEITVYMYLLNVVSICKSS